MFPLTLISIFVLCSYNVHAEFADIQSMKVESSSIFFLETSFRHFDNRKFELNRRTACAVESAAFHHPHRSVYLMYAAPGIFKNLEVKNKFVDALRSYSNVKIVQVHIGKYLKNTPINKLYWYRIIDLSPYKVNHYSDLLRTVTLWKYGGIYMDNDVLVMKPFDDLGENFIGFQKDDKLLGNGVLGFGKEGVPHKLLTNILAHVNEHYNPKSWDGNGPLLYTKWLKNLCKTSNIEQVVNTECTGIKIVPSELFYPLSWYSWRKFFERAYMDEVLEVSRNSYSLHLWNSQTKNFKLKLNSNAPYLIYARELCPKVFEKLDDYF